MAILRGSLEGNIDGAVVVQSGESPSKAAKKEPVAASPTDVKDARALARTGFRFPISDN